MDEIPGLPDKWKLIHCSATNNDLPDHPFSKWKDADILNLLREIAAQESRLSALQQSHERLLEALEVYMSQFGQALEAHGINYGPAQIAADQQARAAIAEATPEGDK